jgi:hypothetical protein
VGVGNFGNCPIKASTVGGFRWLPTFFLVGNFGNRFCFFNYFWLPMLPLYDFRLPTLF